MEKQLSTQEEQLQILKNIFSVNEDSVIVEKEIMKLIEEQIDEKYRFEILQFCLKENDILGEIKIS